MYQRCTLKSFQHMKTIFMKRCGKACVPQRIALRWCTHNICQFFRLATLKGTNSLIEHGNAAILLHATQSEHVPEVLGRWSQHHHKSGKRHKLRGQEDAIPTGTTVSETLVDTSVMQIQTPIMTLKELGISHNWFLDLSFENWRMIYYLPCVSVNIILLLLNTSFGWTHLSWVKNCILSTIIYLYL